MTQLNEPDKATILKRQHNVLEQLNNLKKLLGVIRSNNDTQNTQLSSQVESPKTDQQETYDVVINAHPKSIPYALLIIKDLWKEVLTINVKTFVHSSISELGNDNQKFQDAVEKSYNLTTPKCVINVTLIWNNCENTEMINFPTTYAPIYGEMNIIRYFGRIGPLEYQYEDSLLSNKTDSIVDICYQIRRSTSLKSISNKLNILDQRIGDETYFGGKAVSLADVAVCSTLKRIALLNYRKIPSKLLQWQKRINNTFIIC